MAPTPTDDRLETFSRICFSPWYTRIRTRTLRSERPEYSIIMGNQGDNATAKRQAVVRLLYTSLVGKTGYRPLTPLAQNKRIIIGMTAILFDQESSGRGSWPNLSIPMISPWSSFLAPPLSFCSWSGQSGARMLASLIEHMLLIDYGFGEHPLRKLGPEPAWMSNYMTRVVFHDFCRKLTRLVDDCRSGKEGIWHCRLAWMDESIQAYKDKSSVNDDFSDVALMFYLFWTRRHEITRDEYSRGLTGYEGVLHEMISDIPVCGTDRLTRKLSVDVHKLIPRYVKDKEVRASMIAIAKSTATEYDILLQAPEFAFENLERPSTYNSGGSYMDGAMGQASGVDDDGLSLDRYPTPPPSYNEAIGVSSSVGSDVCEGSLVLTQ